MLRNIDFFTSASFSTSKTSQQRHKRQQALSGVYHGNQHLCTDKLALNKERIHVLYLFAIECYLVASSRLNIVSEIKQHVSNKANLFGENKMNANPILELGQRSRKRKAKSESLPGKRKRAEERVS